MLYDGYFRGLFPAENGRSNEASTSQTNEVKWFPAGGEFGQTIGMMVWHFVSELVEDYNFNFYNFNFNTCHLEFLDGHMEITR
jgi:hypothetical protein